MKFLRDEAGSRARDLALLFFGFGILFFQFLGRLPLIDPDEGRYIEIPREMLERGDFVTPTLNYVKYFEKPPLHYWLNALSLKLFGENEFAARCPGTLCGLLTVLFTYYLGRRLYGRRTGLLAAILLGSAEGFLVQSRINFTDITLTFLITAAFGFFLLASRGERGSGRDYYLFYVFMALAVLAKGLIGIVLPGGVIFLYLLCTRRWRLLKEMRLCTGGLLFLLIAAPWFVLVSLRNPEFAQFFFIHEHFQRFLTKVHHRYQPFWFFVPVLAGTMLPWSLFIPAALKKAWRERSLQQETLYLLLWAGLIFAFFSKSDSKLVPYILPVFPPLAVLIARWFGEAPDRRALRLAGCGTGALISLMGIAALLYPHLAPHPQLSVRDAGTIGLFFLVQGGIALYCSLKGDALRLFAMLAASAAVVAVCVPPVVYDEVAVDKSCKVLGEAVNRSVPVQAGLACFGDYQQGLPFYTHRRVILAGDRDELELGSKQGDQSAWFMSKSEFGRLWNGPGTVFAVVKRKELRQIEALPGSSPRTVAEQGDQLLISNRPLPAPAQKP